jgi:hypothetical protein
VQKDLVHIIVVCVRNVEHVLCQTHNDERSREIWHCGYECPELQRLQGHLMSESNILHAIKYDFLMRIRVYKSGSSPRKVIVCWGDAFYIR